MLKTLFTTFQHSHTVPNGRAERANYQRARRARELSQRHAQQRRLQAHASEASVTGDGHAAGATHSPGNEPRTLRERGGARVPSFRIEHEEVRVARRDGDLSVVFPYATYGARVLLNAPCKTEPKGTAFVTKPGRRLDEVMRELAIEVTTRACEQRDQRHDHSIAMLDDARAAFIAETDEALEHDAMRFDSTDVSTAARSSNALSEQARYEHLSRHRPRSRLAP